MDTGSSKIETKIREGGVGSVIDVTYRTKSHREVREYRGVEVEEIHDAGVTVKRPGSPGWHRTVLWDGIIRACGDGWALGSVEFDTVWPGGRPQVVEACGSLDGIVRRINRQFDDGAEWAAVNRVEFVMLCKFAITGQSVLLLEMGP